MRDPQRHGRAFPPDLCAGVNSIYRKCPPQLSPNPDIYSFKTAALQRLFFLDPVRLSLLSLTAPVGSVPGTMDTTECHLVI